MLARLILWRFPLPICLGNCGEGSSTGRGKRKELPYTQQLEVEKQNGTAVVDKGQLDN